MIYAVIDTNVIVSALFTKNIEAATIKVLKFPPVANSGYTSGND